ncbi:uncharacterized protein LOC104266171 [Ciona intestinalis]
MAVILLKYFKYGLVIFSFVITVVTAVFAFLNSVPINVNTFGTNVMLLAPHIYLHNMELLSEKYPVHITPAGWVFSILWPLIYLWNFIAAAFLVISLCLKPTMNPIMRSPPLLPTSFFVCWILTFGGLLGWLFTFDREIFELSLILLSMSTVTSYCCIVISYKAIDNEIVYLENHRKRLLSTIRILIHNGQGILFAWILPATLLNLIVVMVYHDSPRSDHAVSRELISTEDSGTIVLAIIVVFVIVFFMLENFMFARCTRYTVTIWPTMLFASSGIVVRNWKHPAGDRNSIMACAAVALCGFGFVGKFILFVHYRCKAKNCFRRDRDVEAGK